MPVALSRAQGLRLSRSGDAEAALEVARRAARESAAYRELYGKLGLLDALEAGVPFERLPVVDKEFRLANPLDRLLAAGARVQNLFSSSGASGAEALWPRAGGEHTSFSFGRWLKEHFHVDRHRSLVVVCLTLDRWVGGVSSALGLSHALLEEPGLFTLYCPGPDLDNAARVAAEHAALFDRFVFVFNPCVAGCLAEAARRTGARLPWERCRFAVVGDPFPEALREWADRLCGVSPPETALASFSYSSCETRHIGEETGPAIALRRLLHCDEGLRRDFALGSYVPNLYARVPHEEQPWLEIVDGELVVTRWQPVPLVRYNLRDRAELWSMAEAKRLIAAREVPAPLRPWKAAVDAAPEECVIVAVYGRSNALHLHGVKLYEEGLRQAMAHERLSPLTSGFFHVRVDLSDPSEPLLRWDVELSPGRAPEPGLEALFREVLTSETTRVFPEFGPMLAGWGRPGPDGSPSMVAVRLHEFPALSRDAHRRKFRFIRPLT